MNNLKISSEHLLWNLDTYIRSTLILLEALLNSENVMRDATSSLMWQSGRLSRRQLKIVLLEYAALSRRVMMDR